jgi:hypothetical protein
MPLPKDDDEPVIRDSRDAPNAPVLDRSNSNSTGVRFSAGLQEPGNDRTDGDGKASPDIKKPRKPRSCTKCAEKRDELIKDKSFFEYLLTTKYWKSRAKRIQHRIHEINEVL